MMSDLARRLEEVVSPEIRERFLRTQILDMIKNLLGSWIQITLIPTLLIRKELALPIIRKATLPLYGDIGCNQKGSHPGPEQYARQVVDGRLG